MRPALLLFALALALFCTHAQSQSQQRDENEIVSVREHDHDMVAAIKKGRASLPEFLRIAANPPPGSDGFKLKVMVVDGVETEHFWVTPFKSLPDGFAGILANEPKSVKNVKAGQVIRFDQSVITDWGYTQNGRQVGSFTVCVLFKRMPRDQAEYYRKNHGFDC